MVTFNPNPFTYARRCEELDVRSGPDRMVVEANPIPAPEERASPPMVRNYNPDLPLGSLLPTHLPLTACLGAA